MKNENVMEVDIRTKDQKKAELKEKIKCKIQNGKNWIIRNKEAVIVFTPIVINGITTVTKVVGKHINLRKQESVKNLYCYDRKLGHYWSLRRELTNDEWLEIDRRKRDGEQLSDILYDLRVLR